MKPRVVVSLLTSAQEFQLLQAEDARASAQRAGIEVEIVFAENNPVQQIHQLYQFIHAPDGQRPAAIVVEAVSREGMERVARNAVRAGIGWLPQQWKTDYMETLPRENSRVPVASVSVDEPEIGRLQARQFAALLPQGGAVLFVQGPPDSLTAARRFQGLQEGIRAAFRIELKVVLNGDWTAGSAEAAVTSWLRLRTSASTVINLVGSQNDSMAEGARKAILQLRSDWTGLPFTGCDGVPEGGRRMVDARQLAATIVKPTTTGPAIELVARALRGQPIPPELVLQPQSYPPLPELASRRPTSS
jgi:ABC-type sugar transport system substrate-binding protein